MTPTENKALKKKTRQRINAIEDTIAFFWENISKENPDKLKELETLFDDIFLKHCTKYGLVEGQDYFNQRGENE